MKSRLGAVGFVVGLLGAGFGIGGVEASMTNAELLYAVGVTASSLMLMYLGTLLIRDEI